MSWVIILDSFLEVRCTTTIQSWWWRSLLLVVSMCGTKIMGEKCMCTCQSAHSFMWYVCMYLSVHSCMWYMHVSTLVIFIFDDSCCICVWCHYFVLLLLFHFAVMIFVLLLLYLYCCYYFILLLFFRYWYKNGCLFPDLLTVFIAIDKCWTVNGCLQVGTIPSINMAERAKQHIL